ncbi:hypothetical protein [Corallococcus exiguus]|uniref:Uncharacterized protein n=2 Tax=Corallococcus exiguus TaxID=83462 RepID=A0A7X4YKC8_9BACT|nr:hypothetical protein [Corallococcus exiguus]NBC46279.1 hypothetical protein [Corallococcus exiguus]TNV62347.1 hypothetical protein FH620_18300 [Corallococcus exiguus]
MDLTLRDEVNRLLSPDMNITGLGDVSVDWQSQGAGVQARFPDLHGIRQEISYMSLSEAKQAGITLYGDASFSIDAYPVERFQGFAHFVASVIVHEAHRGRSLRGIELDPFMPEKGWKTLFGRFAKGVAGNNIFSGRKRLGVPSRACMILSTGNEQLYALDCSGSYGTLILQTS